MQNESQDSLTRIELDLRLELFMLPSPRSPTGPLPITQGIIPHSSQLMKNDRWM